VVVGYSVAEVEVQLKAEEAERVGTMQKTVKESE
jgi:hypothetical protein